MKANQVVSDVYVWNRLEATHQSLRKTKSAACRTGAVVKSRVVEHGKRAPRKLPIRTKVWRAFVAAAAIVAVSGKADAALPVIDMSALQQLVAQYGQMLKDAVMQAQQLATTAQQLQWQINEFESFVQSPNLGAAMGLMQQFGITNPLPVNPMAIEGLLNGSGGINGALSGLANSAHNMNHVYSPTDGSWNSQQLIANGNSIAGSQGLAMAAYQQLADHIPIIQQLRQDLLSAAQDPAQREHVMAQLQVEETWAQNLNGEVQAAALMANEEQAARAQRDNEALDQSIDANLQQAAAQGAQIPQ
jgi:hypothetical protein